MLKATCCTSRLKQTPGSNFMVYWCSLDQESVEKRSWKLLTTCFVYSGRVCRRKKVFCVLHQLPTLGRNLPGTPMNPLVIGVELTWSVDFYRIQLSRKRNQSIETTTSRFEWWWMRLNFPWHIAQYWTCCIMMQKAHYRLPEGQQQNIAVLIRADVSNIIRLLKNQTSEKSKWHDYCPVWNNNP